MAIYQAQPTINRIYNFFKKDPIHNNNIFQKKKLQCPFMQEFKTF